MPELPEVETVARGLTPFMAGQQILRVDVRRADLRVPFPPALSSALKNRTIERIERRAKYILVHAGKDILVLHLGMSGQVRILSSTTSYSPQKHDHMILYLSNGGAVVFHDPRRFGMVLLIETKGLNEHPAFADLGPEPLSEDFSSDVLGQALKGRKVHIKQALLNQQIVAGIGNIYASEALFGAGISPTKPAGRLTAAQREKLVESIRSVLKLAIKAGGSTLKDYRKADGELGYFQNSFSVYDCDGQACPRCQKNDKKKAIIQKILQGGRATYFCPQCQK